MYIAKTLMFLLPAACLLAQTAAPQAEPAKQAPAKPAAKPAPALNPAAPSDPKPATPLASTSVDPAKVVLQVGEDKVTAGEFEALVAALPEQYRRYAQGPGKRQFAEQLVRMKVLSLEAQKRKLDQKPEVQSQLRMERENLLASTMFQDMTANAKIDDAALHTYYDSHKSEYEQIKARHILIKAKGSPIPGKPAKPELTDEQALAKAQEIRKRLVAGEDFATVAKAESDDTGTGANGGDLGTFSRTEMIPQFTQVAFALPIGEVSEPVKTQFGYHLIKVDAHTNKTFQDVQPEIEKKMRPEIARQSVEELTQKTSVTIDDSFFGPAPASPAPAQLPSGASK